MTAASWRGPAAAVALLLAACGGPAGSAPASAGLRGTVTVFAAASLTEPFGTIGRQFEAAHPGARVAFSFGASSTLAAQIRQGAPADVFASASPKNMDDVLRAGAAQRATAFAANVAEIAVAPGNPKRVAGLADLGRPDLKVALCQPEVPCGALAQQVLASAGTAVRPVTLESDVKATLAKVQLGEVDAGIVYASDVRAAAGKVAGVPVPAAQNAATSYPIAALTGSRNRALADAFVAWVLSPEGGAVLRAAGFAPP